MKRGWLFWAVVMALTAGAVLVGLRLGREAAGVQGSADRRAGEGSATALPVPVRTVIARAGDLVVYEEVAGTVRPAQEVTVSARVPGRVLRVPVQVGERVRQGQVLVELETQDLEAQVRQAQAALASARTQAAQAAENRRRMEELYQAGVVSPQQLEAARAQDEVAQNAVQTASSALELAQRQLENARLTAPLSGVVTALNVDPGELVGAGVPLAAVAALDEVLVEGGVGERTASHLRPGQEVEVILDLPSRQVWRGIVSSVSPAADPVTRLFTVKVKLNNPDLRLKAGSFARLRVAVEERRGAVLIPLEAVVRRGEETYVFVVEGTTARLKPVRLGLEDGLRCEVLTWLAGGEEVVTAGQDNLRDGSAVAVVERGDAS
ncbi:MAG: efflux RND transporter periplasmic adaptor subunit [Bacillota bacterium]|nr:efflux RND transporter periplasmic adaptor subunit [Bacillota bacterium]